METNVLDVAPDAYLENPARLRALAASGLLSADREPALDRWTRLAATLIDAPVALLSLVDRDRQLLKSSAGLPAGTIGRDTPLSHSFCRHVVARRALLVIVDAREDPLVRESPAVAEFGVIAYAGAPVTTSDGHTLGAFCVIDTKPRAWTPAELALLEDLTAGLLAELDLRAALRTTVALQADLARQARIDVLTGLASRRQLARHRRTGAAQVAQAVLLGVLREREPGLDKHVREVAVLAGHVAARLDLEAAVVEEVVLAAYLHDIGKVAIPDGILAKKGPLDEGEWAIMRGHTLVGERIVGAAPVLRRVATLVRSSHERWDGAGYPDGLAGSATPLGSRVILACDAYDAITSDRPYAPARTPHEARAELRAQAGRQFDPAVVAALLAVLESREALARTAPRRQTSRHTPPEDRT